MKSNRGEDRGTFLEPEKVKAVRQGLAEKFGVEKTIQEVFELINTALDNIRWNYFLGTGQALSRREMYDLIRIRGMKDETR